MKKVPSIVVISNCYPNQYKIDSCMFVKRHVDFHRESGLNVLVLSPADSRKGIFSILKYLQLLFQVLLTALRYDFDIVHAHFPFPAGIYGVLLSAIKRRPLIITSHGAFVDNLDQHNHVVRKAVKFALRRADRLIAVGQEHSLNVTRASDIPSSQMDIINMGVYIQPERPEQTQARIQLGLQQSTCYILFIGNLIHRKGVDLLLHALAELKSTYDFRLIIGGSGPLKEDLEELTRQLDLAECVQFTGIIEHDNVYKWFAAANVCVVPSRKEPFGIVPLEAMACRTPVIASNTGGLSENIQHGVNGLLFDVDDKDSLKRQLQQFFEGEVSIETLVENGHQTANTLDMAQRAADVAKIYYELTK